MESTVKSPDLCVRDDGNEVVVGENSGSLNGERPDVGAFKGKRLPEAPAEESICVKRARPKSRTFDDPVFRSKHADIFTCQRCGNEENIETLIKLGAIKCSACRFIMWFPRRYHLYKDAPFVNVYPDGYVEVMDELKKKWGRGSCVLSFPYGEDDLMDFEVTITPKVGLYKRAKVVFSIDVPPLYPDESPVVRCKTKIFHPLIDLEGNVGIGFLGEYWSPNDHSIHTVVIMLKKILSIRGKVNWAPVVTLNHEADAMWRADRKVFSRKVREALAGGFVEKTYFPRCLIDK